MHQKPIHAILFDLDGTLVDNFGAIYASYSHMQSVFGRKSVSFDQLKQAVGGGIRATMQQVLGKEDVDEDLVVYREYYKKNATYGLSLLPGAREVLQALKKKRYSLGVLTNKCGESARYLCDYLGIGEYLSVVVGEGDTPFCKPHRIMTDYALRTLFIEPENAVLVGDSPFDIQTAKNANMGMLAVATGTHDKEALLLETANVYSDMWELGREVFGLEIGAA